MFPPQVMKLTTLHYFLVVTSWFRVLNAGVQLFSMERPLCAAAPGKEFDRHVRKIWGNRGGFERYLRKIRVLIHLKSRLFFQSREWSYLYLLQTFFFANLASRPIRQDRVGERLFCALFLTFHPPLKIQQFLSIEYEHWVIRFERITGSCDEPPVKDSRLFLALLSTKQHCEALDALQSGLMFSSEHLLSQC